MLRQRSNRDHRSYGFLCGRIFPDLQKSRSFWRLRRQTALAMMEIEDADQDLRQNASQSSINRQSYPLIKAENLSELPEPPLSGLLDLLGTVRLAMVLKPAGKHGGRPRCAWTLEHTAPDAMR